MDIEERFRRLLLSALDGDASCAELEQLNELLRQRPDLRRSAVRFLCDGSYLTRAIRSIDKTAAFLDNLRTASVDENLPSHTPGARAEHVALSSEVLPRNSQNRSSVSLTPKYFLLATLRLVNRHGLAVAATAAALMFALAWQYSVMMSKFDRLQSIAAHPDPVDRGQLGSRSRVEAGGLSASSAARVTGLVNCQWVDGATPLEFGDVLPPGSRLRLQKGLIQLTFATGAKVVVEGPANFVVTAPGQATLERGQIAAAVPRFARGYTILTPTAEVVDLGTEFGVAVDDAGRSEVHVFEGDVVARPRSSDSHGSLVHARQDEAVEFSSPNEQARHITADRHRFVRRLTPDRSIGELPPLPVTKELTLWLAADMIPESKEDAPVSTWSDILIGGNRFPDDAWQFDERLCPKWVRDGHGRPALRFNGWSTYLATSPMATSSEFTAFVVFASTPVSFASDFHGGMLLKFGGDTPSLEFSLMPDRTPKARVWARHDDGTSSYVGEVQGPVVEPQVVCAVAYTYDVKDNRAELLVNGKSAGVAPAPASMEQNARRYIGAHAEPRWQAYFLGDMYEVIVYDKSLDTSDRDQVFQYLSRRYQLPLGK